MATIYLSLSAQVTEGMFFRNSQYHKTFKFPIQTNNFCTADLKKTLILCISVGGVMSIEKRCYGKKVMEIVFFEHFDRFPKIRDVVR